MRNLSEQASDLDCKLNRFLEPTSRWYMEIKAARDGICSNVFSYANNNNLILHKKIIEAMDDSELPNDPDVILEFIEDEINSMAGRLNTIIEAKCQQTFNSITAKYEIDLILQGKREGNPDQIPLGERLVSLINGFYSAGALIIYYSVSLPSTLGNLFIRRWQTWQMLNDGNKQLSQERKHAGACQVFNQRIQIELSNVLLQLYIEKKTEEYANAFIIDTRGKLERIKNRQVAFMKAFQNCRACK